MKIRLLHLLTDPENSQKEQESADNLKEFCSLYPVEYHQTINQIYKNLPPSENCNRPHNINVEPGNGNLSPGHYGCFMAHKNAINLPDNKDYDTILVFEDAIISSDFEQFYKRLEYYYKIVQDNDLDIFNMGNNQGPGYTFDKEMQDHLLGVHFFIPAHSYMIPQNKLKQVQFKLNTCPWDAYDLWVTKVAKLKTGCSKKIYTKHCSGYSYVDKCIKNF